MRVRNPPGVWIRPATLADAPEVAGLAADLAQSFAFDRASFDASYPVLIGDDNALRARCGRE